MYAFHILARFFAVILTEKRILIYDRLSGDFSEMALKHKRKAESVVHLKHLLIVLFAKARSVCLYAYIGFHH